MECWEYQNKYDVADENGEQTFFLKEESSCLMRACCANARELEVSMQDMNGKELLRFDRPLKCMECPCDGCYPNWTQVRKSQGIPKRNWGVFNSPPKNNEKSPIISALASKEWSK